MYPLSLQDKGVARKMVNDSIAVAKEPGYNNILLDMNREMGDAVNLYKKMRFDEIPACYENENLSPVWFCYKL